MGRRDHFDALTAHAFGLLAEGGADHLPAAQEGVEPPGPLIKEVAEGQMAGQGTILDVAALHLGIDEVAPVHSLEGGVAAWSEAGLPLKKGARK